jgi:hypothetical protein
VDGHGQNQRLDRCRSGGACYLTCDFWCSSNWRIQQDSPGCPVWRYDYDFNPCEFDAGDARHD